MGRLQFLYTLIGVCCLINHVHGKLTDEYFRHCNGFFYKGKPPSGLKNPQEVRYICQTYKDKVRFAGLYNTMHRIPFYSAYTLHPESNTKPQPERPKRWFIEPELSDIKKPMGNMLRDKKCCDAQQATEDDYFNKTVPEFPFDRGHMNPNSYQHKEGRTATFTLTNVVPQAATFNKGSWAVAETGAKQHMMEHCTGKGSTSYFVTGAVPGTELLNDRVNIPKLMWTAAVCGAQVNVHVAYYGENIANASVTQMPSIDDLQDLLKQFSNVYESTFEIFYERAGNGGIIDKVEAGVRNRDHGSDESIGKLRKRQ